MVFVGTMSDFLQTLVFHLLLLLGALHKVLKGMSPLMLASKVKASRADAIHLFFFLVQFSTMLVDFELKGGFQQQISLSLSFP